MDSISARLCRLCLETSDDVVNIFDIFQESTIASVLSQHFWFQVYENDGLSESLCEICWNHTITFHDFYKRIESRHSNYLKSDSSIDKKIGDPDVETNFCVDSIKQERSGSPGVILFKPDLTIVKYEEPSLEVIDVHASKDEGSDDKSCARSESVHSSDHDYQHPIKRRDKKTKGNEKLTPSKRSERKRRTPCDNTEMDAKIREFFTMKCDICTDDADFETFRDVKKHYRTVHKEKGYITCCGKKFRLRCKVLNHIENHLNPDAYRCDQCGKQFFHKHALESHIANHEPRTLRAFKCNLCSSSFTKAVGLKYHMQNTHASEKGGKFPCDKCNKICQSKLSLACHTRYIHELEPIYICDTCARTFKTKTLLLTHMQVHSTTPLPKAQRNICGAWLKHEASLRKHLQLHQDVKLNCLICNKIVKNKLSLQRHIRQVHSERRHQCTLCDKAFKTIKMLKEHVAIHTGEYLYNCPYCEKKFKSGANMFSHRKKAHLKEWTRDRAKKVVLTET